MKTFHNQIIDVNQLPKYKYKIHNQLSILLVDQYWSHIWNQFLNQLTIQFKCPMSVSSRIAYNYWNQLADQIYNQLYFQFEYEYWELLIERDEARNYK